FDHQGNRPDLRNHRKIVVVDGRDGFTGSPNLIENTYHKRGNIRKGLYYIELVARVTGPIVQQLNAVFLTDWHAETGVLLDAPTMSETQPFLQGSGDWVGQG